jgi:hypothetical protein
MSRGRCTFKQADVTRAIKALVAAGVPVERVRIKINVQNGEIQIATGGPEAVEPVEHKREIVL